MVGVTGCVRVCVCGGGGGGGGGGDLGRVSPRGQTSPKLGTLVE